MKQKTAMQELVDRYFLFENGEYQPDAFKKHFAEFYPLHLLREKEQILDAHLNGQQDHHFSLESRMAESEDYYNETYNQNK
jgi:hypothetical protein